MTWNRFSLDFGLRTHVMGILNVTPDSFSDGGLYSNVSAAIDRALRMEDEGADIIDIGGESTRPGSESIALEEELRRTIPVIERLSGRVSIPVSIDTCKAEVARLSLDAGASMVNDISGLRFDRRMPGVVAQYRVPVVVMHMKGTPGSMQENPFYDSLLSEIMEFFRESIGLALASGIQEDMVIVDPGIGFGKTFDHNLEIINNLSVFAALSKPLLIGPSRKAFLGKILGGVSAAERLEGTAAAVAISIMRGANIIRVHDVKEMVKVARVADAIRKEKII